MPLVIRSSVPVVQKSRQLTLKKSCTLLELFLGRYYWKMASLKNNFPVGCFFPIFQLFRLNFQKNFFLWNGFPLKHDEKVRVPGSLGFLFFAWEKPMWTIESHIRALSGNQPACTQLNPLGVSNKLPVLVPWNLGAKAELKEKQRSNWKPRKSSRLEKHLYYHSSRWRKIGDFLRLAVVFVVVMRWIAAP